MDGVTYRKKSRLTTILVMGVDHDTGLNTGGMGTVAPNPYYCLLYTSHRTPSSCWWGSQRP